MLLIFASALALGACSSKNAGVGGNAAEQQSARQRGRRSNLDVGWTSRWLPGDDFFAMPTASGPSDEIPADRSNWGAFASIAEDTNARIVKLIDALAAETATPKAERRGQMANFYKAYIEDAAIERPAWRR